MEANSQYLFCYITENNKNMLVEEIMVSGKCRMQNTDAEWS